MNDERYHVYLFTGCYALLGTVYPVIMSETMRPLFVVAFYAALTPGLLWYAVQAYRES